MPGSGAAFAVHPPGQSTGSGPLHPYTNRLRALPFCQAIGYNLALVLAFARR
jgi:hypothetical protein